jgi:hypothetical protein
MEAKGRRIALTLSISLLLALALAGEAVAAAITPASAAFGRLSVGGQSAPLAFTINGDPGPFGAWTNVSILSAAPGGFRQTNNCPNFLVAPKTCTVTIVFNPTSGPVGRRNAQLIAGGARSYLTGRVVGPKPAKACGSRKHHAAATPRRCRKR